MTEIISIWFVFALILSATSLLAGLALSALWIHRELHNILQSRRQPDGVAMRDSKHVRIISGLSPLGTGCRLRTTRLFLISKILKWLAKPNISTRSWPLVVAEIAANHGQKMMGSIVTLVAKNSVKPIANIIAKNIGGSLASRLMRRSINVEGKEYESSLWSLR